MNNTVATLKFIVFLSVSIPVVFIDIKEYKIPDKFILPGIAASALICLFPDDDLPLFLLNLLSGFLFFLTIRILTKKKLGFGDVKYAAFLAGILGIPAYLTAIFSASVFGILFSVLMIVSGKMKKTDPLPFAPFLAIGAVFASLIDVTQLFHFV